ncbi:hypothetical protein M413DRAFT_306128 [Hebeloma cylindrosporum]|uniref:Nuclear segregation protein Bfr1 n=1 Tax=Hebeloma cylindrosporum TaxID=76867 RepID=A0A0C3CQ21_HEBCY|nr:hypothetical protein M413DRAFT_306128 [Hebeloma cylindrosporum h7]
MAAPKTKTKSASNGNVSKDKAASTSGTATPATTFAEKDTSDHLAAFAGGKPDKKLYDTEQAKIKGEIDTLQAKLSTVRDKITLATKSGPGNDRRNALRAELDGIREQQSTNKNSRGKQLDQIKAIQENIQKKIKDLQGAKSKIPFKNVGEVDAHIKNLEKQVESGNMKLADEKRALQEISSTKKSRRAVEGFQADQESIEADRQKIEELRKELDDPVSKAVSERYDAIKAELDELKKESDEAYAGRSKLFEERDRIQSQLKVLFDEKRESGQRYRDANDRYWNKVNEDRARRAEKARAQRAAEEAQKKKDIAERLLEEAQAPAFQAQIEDCQTLIDFFSGKHSGNVAYKSAPLTTKAEVAGVPKLELRQVEAQPEGVIIRKKKGEEQDAYFVGKSKSKGKKGPKANGSLQDGTTTPTAPTPSSSSLNVPLPTLSALLSLSIPPPAANTDVPRVVEDLNTKKAWFEANQARVTSENIAKATAEIQRLSKGDVTSELDPSNSGGESPAEPTSTPQTGVTAVPVSSEMVVDKLEVVQEDEAAKASP